MTSTQTPPIGRLAWSRTRAHGALAAGVGILIAIVVFLIATLGAWITVDTHRALAQAVGSADAASLTFQTRIGDDSAAQDAAADGVIRSALGDAVDITRTDDGSRVQYVVTVAAESLTPASVARIADGAGTIEDRFRVSAAAVGGMQMSGTLTDTIGDARIGAAASAAIAPIPLAIVAVLGWFAVMELSRAWGRARGRETALLTARGLSRTQKFVLAASEVGVISLAAAAIGAGAAALVMFLRAGTDGLNALAGGSTLTIAAIVVLLVTAGVGVARAAESETHVSSRAARLTRVASVGALALVIVAAVVVVWQLFSAQDQPIDAMWRVALSSLAPILALVAAALLAVLISAPLAYAIARISAQRSRLSPVYPARQVARRLPAYATAVALVVITTAGAMFAASYVATWDRASTSAAALTAGASVRASSDTVSATDMRTAEGLGPAAAVYATDVVVGDKKAAMIAISPDRVADVVLPVEGLVDPTYLQAKLDSDAEPLSVPEGATSIRVSAHVVGAQFPAASLRSQLWVIDGAGLASPVAISRMTMSVISAVPDPEGGYYGDIVTAEMTGEAALPPGTVGVVSFGISVAAGGQFNNATVDISQLGLAGVDTAGAATPIEFKPYTPKITLGDSVFDNSLNPYATMWTPNTSTSRVPAVLTDSFAKALDLAVGDDVDLRVDGAGRTIKATVSAITRVIPGTTQPNAALVNLTAMSGAASVSGAFSDPPTTSPATPNQIWFGEGVAVDDVKSALRMDVKAPSDVAALVTGSLITTWWVAPLGAAALAAIALIAMLASITSTRGGEVLVLSAVGVPVRQQARMRVVESGTVALLAAILGLAAGWGISRLIAPVLVSTAVPGMPLFGGPSFALVLIALVIVILCAGLVIGALVIAAMVRQQSRSARRAEAAE